VTLTLLAMAAQLSVTLAVRTVPEIDHFPGSYFDTTARVALQRRVMEQWPGPTALAEIWHASGTRQRDRIAILLGAAAHHDPSLIPLYQDGIARNKEMLRKAAVYGFRDLVGDRVPDVTPELSESGRRRVIFEMENIRRTLQREPLVAMWLQSLLRNERKVFPGYRGFALPRRTRDCLRSIERVMTIDDLELLVRAFQVSEDRTTRIGLLQLIESLSLSRFVPKHMGRTPAWGPEVYTKGVANLEAAVRGWTAQRCFIGVDGILVKQMAAMGAPVSNPRTMEACDVWLNVMRKGDPNWWPTAAKQLYLCGGPWIELSVLWSDSDANQTRREQFINWYRPPLKRPTPTPRAEGPPS
jgi:hypothetical protein